MSRRSYVVTLNRPKGRFSLQHTNRRDAIEHTQTLLSLVESFPAASRRSWCFWFSYSHPPHGSNRNCHQVHNRQRMLAPPASHPENKGQLICLPKRRRSPVRYWITKNLYSSDTVAIQLPQEPTNGVMLAPSTHQLLPVAHILLSKETSRSISPLISPPERAWCSIPSVTLASHALEAACQNFEKSEESSDRWRTQHPGFLVYRIHDHILSIHEQRKKDIFL